MTDTTTTARPDAVAAEARIAWLGELLWTEYQRLSLGTLSWDEAGDHVHMKWCAIAAAVVAAVDAERAESDRAYQEFRRALILGWDELTQALGSPMPPAIYDAWGKLTVLIATDPLPSPSDGAATGETEECDDDSVGR